MRKAFECSIPGGPTVVIAELTPSEVLTAMRGAGRGASAFAARLECVRHALRQVDGHDVRYLDVTGERLRALVPRTRHQFALSIAWGRIHEPNDETVERMHGTLSPEIGPDGERWTATLPDGRRVVLAEQSPETVAEALTRAQRTNKGEALQFFAGLLDSVRISLVEVDGRTVSQAELAGKGWDQRFSVAETFLLGAAWNEIHVSGGADLVGELKPVLGTPSPTPAGTGTNDSKTS